MAMIQPLCDRFNVNIFLLNGDEERFEKVIDISIDGYYIIVLTDEGCRTIKSKQISSVHISVPNREFDGLFELQERMT